MSLFAIPYSITRSIQIDAPQERVFEAVRNFHTWNQWSPWLCTERTAKVDISGSGKEIGDIYAWDGNLVGAGEIEHRTREEYKHMEQKLRFTKPFKSVSRIWFDFVPEANDTKITWGMRGELPFFLFAMKKRMVAMLGNDFERGLQMLKDLVETGKVEFSMEYVGVVELPAAQYMGITKETSLTEMSTSIQGSFARLLKTVEQNNINPNGAMFCIYHQFDMINQHMKYTAAIPVPTEVDIHENDVFSAKRETTKALKIIHTGDYKYLGNSWMGAYSYIYKTKGLKEDKAHSPIEIYVNDPTELLPEQWRTEIYIPVR